MAKIKYNGLLFTFLAGVLWGTISISVRGLNSAGISSMQIVFIRGFLTVVLLGAYMLIFNRKLFKIKLKDIWCFFGTGIVSVLVFTFFHFYTMTIASISFETVMMYTAPFFVIFFSAILFGEKITVKKLIASIIAFSGCALVSGLVTGNDEIPFVAVLTGLGAGFFYALYTIFGRYAVDRNYDTLTITFYTFVFSAVGSAFFAKPWEIAEIAKQDKSVMIYAVVIAVLNTILPYLLYNIGLKNAENGPAIIASSIEPVVATVVGIIVYDEIPDIFSAIGIIMVLFAVVLLNLNKKKQ
ncbi:MAG: EamA family transporter [Clostridiales bacterium]|nr:EamA family transporter [Candidatus Equinaster intestinalis]